MATEVRTYKQEAVPCPKPFGVTADGQLVPPTHYLARQIICHFPGQEVPSFLLDQAGLLSTDGTRVNDFEYAQLPDWDDVKELGTDTAGNPTAGLTIEDVLTNDDLAKGIAAIVADEVKKARAEDKKALDKAIADGIAAALKKTGA